MKTRFAIIGVLVILVMALFITPILGQMSVSQLNVNDGMWAGQPGIFAIGAPWLSQGVTIAGKNSRVFSGTIDSSACAFFCGDIMLGGTPNAPLRILSAGGTTVKPFASLTATTLAMTTAKYPSGTVFYNTDNAGLTVTLPSLASAPVGLDLTFVNNAGSGALAIVCTSGDTFITDNSVSNVRATSPSGHLIGAVWRVLCVAKNKWIFINEGTTAPTLATS
jgi:hypothetical protein